MSDPRFAELLDEYWNVAIKQGWERRSTDDELGSAQDAEHALHQYVDRLTRELAEAKKAREDEHAQFLAVGSRYVTAKVDAANARDKALEEAAKVADAVANDDHDGYGDLNVQQGVSEDIAAAIRALKEKP